MINLHLLLNLTYLGCIVCIVAIIVLTISVVKDLIEAEEEDDE